MKRILEIARGVAAHIHIPVGRLLMIIACVGITFGTVLNAAELPAPKLISAESDDGHWRASVRIDALPGATSAGEAHIVQDGINCASRPIAIAPHGSAYLRDFAKTYFCGPADFQLFTVTNASAFTVLSFDDGVNRSSFAIGAIGAVTSDAPAQIPEAVSDDAEGTWINAIGNGELVVDFYDGSNALIGTERVTVAGVTQKQLATKGVGRLVVSLSSCHCGGGGYVDGTPIYGFVTVGSPKGGNLRAYVFGR